MQIDLEYDADDGYRLIVGNDADSRVFLPPEGVTEAMLRSAEDVIRSVTLARDLAWQDQDADEVDNPAIAMATREAWQSATSHLLDLFKVGEA